MLVIILMSVILLFMIFVAVSFFMLMKDYKLKVDDQIFRIHNVGSTLSVFVNNQLVIKDQSPNLIGGTEYSVNVLGKDYLVKCKSNKFGNVLQVEIFKDGEKIADNGKVVKQKTKVDK